MEQESLFYDSIYDALKTCVRAIAAARSPGQTEKSANKIVGFEMWSTMTPDRAGTLLANKLNPETRDVLHPEEMLWLLREARKVGCHVAMAFLASESGYKTPEPVTREEQVNELYEQFVRTAERLEGMASVIKRLKGVS